jgi:hypothetical protein
MVAQIDVYVLRDTGPILLGCTKTNLDAVELIEKSGTGNYCVLSKADLYRDFYNVRQDGAVVLVECRDALSP